jgi:hypothetical protein
MKRSIIKSGFMLRVMVATPITIAGLISGNDVDARHSQSTHPTIAQPGVRVVYGAPQKLGNGSVRTYIVLDEAKRAPVEVGVALSEGTVQSPPAAPAGHAGHDMAAHAPENMRILEMPAQNPTAYKFARLDWNSAGHEPPGVYDLPHFDFHFYRVPVAVMNSIVPTDPQYAKKAANMPGKEQHTPYFVDGATAAKAPADAVTVPQMGLHWLDVRSPELQGLVGNPQGARPFTKTFILGTWDGQFIFDEPMITRAYLLEKSTTKDAAMRDEIITLPQAQKYVPAGFYPGAYRIAYDPQAKEYRVALTQLAWRE